MTNIITTSPAEGRASKTFGVVASDNAFKVTALEPGVAGNALALRVVVAGNNTPLTVTETGGVITVNSATGAGGAATSTADAIVAELNSDTDSNDLISASAEVGDSDGTGIVGAVTQAVLTGGVDVRVSSVKVNKVITDPEAENAVQIPPEADASGRDVLAVHAEDAPNDVIDAF